MENLKENVKRIEEVKKLYLKKYEFNIAIFIDKLNKIILENNGFLTKSWNYSTYPFNLKKEKTKIYNRYLLKDSIDFEKESFEKYKNKNIPIEYLIESEKNYTSFILDNIYYYIQINDNPFFDCYIQKIKVEKVENKNYKFYSGYNYYMEKVSEDLKGIYWELYDYLTIKQIEKLAKKAFELIKKQNFSKIVTNKKRVLNYYDGKYHYEHIPEKRKTYYFI